MGVVFVGATSGMFHQRGGPQENPPREPRRHLNGMTIETTRHFQATPVWSCFHRQLMGRKRPRVCAAHRRTMSTLNSSRLCSMNSSSSMSREQTLRPTFVRQKLQKIGAVQVSSRLCSMKCPLRSVNGKSKGDFEKLRLLYKSFVIVGPANQGYWRIKITQVCSI